MIQAVSRRPLTAEGRIRSQFRPREIYDGPNGTGDKFYSQYFSFPTVSKFPLMFHTHFHPKTTFIRRPSGQGLGTFKTTLLHVLGSTGKNIFSCCLVFKVCSNVVLIHRTRHSGIKVIGLRMFGVWCAPCA